jgi:pantetheine-phosphate adenylyltransferase
MPNSQIIGIYPGMFDPVTNGHVDIIHRALKVVDHLVVAVAEDNSAKQPTFTNRQRCAMINETFLSFTPQERARVTVEGFSGLLVNFAGEKGARVIVRGLRAVSDFEYEFQMSCVNSKLAPQIETVFIPASDRTQFISSRFVKEVARLGGDVGEFVPKHVVEALSQVFKTGS